MAITDPASLAGNFVYNTYTFVIGDGSTQIVPSNNERVALIVCNNSSGINLLTPYAQTSGTEGIEVGASATGNQTVYLYYHNIGNLVGQPWFVFPVGSTSNPMTVIEVIYRPQV